MSDPKQPPREEEKEFERETEQIPAETEGALAPERYPDERYGRDDQAPPMSDTSGPRSSE